jgi:hypothetical protein
MPEVITRLLYRSDRVLNGAELEVEAQLQEILETSRCNNERDGLTGLTLYTAEAFAQILEGPTKVVEATFERICCDLRHRRVRILEMTKTNQRMFASWQDTQALLTTGIRPRRAAMNATLQLMRDSLQQPISSE